MDALQEFDDTRDTRHFVYMDLHVVIGVQAQKWECPIGFKGIIKLILWYILLP